MSLFGQTSMEYLFFWVTHHGTKPINKKIKSITNINPPTTRKEARQFIGGVNYYCNMWARCSYMLETLTKITSNKVKFKWTKIDKKCFR